MPTAARMPRRRSSGRGPTMNRNARIAWAVSAAVLVVAGCATVASDAEISQRALAVMKSGFKEAGQAKLDRLDQDEVQAACSKYHSSTQLPKELAQKLEESQLKTIKYPADGK